MPDETRRPHYFTIEFPRTTPKTLLDGHELRHAAVLGADDAAQVVPDQVHDHEVLGALLGATQDGVGVVPRDTGPLLDRALDGAVLQPALPVPGQEPLRAASGERHVVELEEGAKRGGVLGAEALVQGPRVESGGGLEMALVGQAELMSVSAARVS